MTLMSRSIRWPHDEVDESAGYVDLFDYRHPFEVASDVLAQLRSGELDPQDAFMDGRIEIEGDMEMAIGLALAALSPD